MDSLSQAHSRQVLLIVEGCSFPFHEALVSAIKKNIGVLACHTTGEGRNNFVEVNSFLLAHGSRDQTLVVKLCQ